MKIKEFVIKDYLIAMFGGESVQKMITKFNWTEDNFDEKFTKEIENQRNSNATYLCGEILILQDEIGKGEKNTDSLPLEKKLSIYRQLYDSTLEKNEQLKQNGIVEIKEIKSMYNLLSLISKPF